MKNIVTLLHWKQKSIVAFIKERRTVKILHLFRNYSSFIVVVSCSLLVSATNLSAGQESSGFLFGYLGAATDNYANPLEDKFFLKANQKTSLALAPLAEAKIVPDPALQDNEGSLSDPMLMQGNALVSENCPVLKDPEEDGGVIIYEVRSGDTTITIAAANKITVNTLLWANAIDDIDSIMPGDKIFILPVSGLSYTVKKGDDIKSIAKEFKAEADKIIAFNSLPANGDIEEGEEIVIPNGQKELPKPKPAARGLNIAERPYESFESTGKNLIGGKGGHIFPYGYCTWYVAQKRKIPWSGNAGTWLYKAKASGYATGKTPRVGSVMVSSESWWGHVGIVESVSSDSFTISEMNYKGWGKKSTRIMAKGSRVIKGFIY